jgi:TPR repeat protein
MRFVVIAGVTAASIFAAGCSSVAFNAGLPILTKGGKGMLVSETSGPPDLERGRHARLAGELEKAMKDLKPLAERGYPDAMTLLASTYLDLGTIAARDEAEKWYRRALKARPDAGLSLARLLIGYGKRERLSEIDGLIHEAERRGDEEIDSVRLQQFTQFPDLDVKADGDRIAQRALRSSYPAVQVAALMWLRQNIAKGNNAAILEAACRERLQIDPSCYIDLAHFYRYQGKQDQLRAIVANALVTFETGAESSVERPESARLYEPPTQYASLAGRLAAAMVDEINEENNEDDAAEQQSAAPAQSDLDFEDDDFEGDRPPVASATDVAIVNPGRPKTQAVDTASPATTAAAPAATPQSVELADKILRWMLSKGGDFSMEAAVVAVHYPFLLPEINLEAALQPAADAGIPAAVSALADLLFNGQRQTTRRPLEAIDLYKRCLSFVATEVRANTRLGRAYAMGILGDADPQLALKHYLKAGRSGSAQAYSSLARMFLGTSGIQVNRVNGYVFAKRSEDAGRVLTVRVRKLKRLNELQLNLESADMFDVVQVKLLDQLVGEMTATDLTRAERLYQLEKNFQPVLKQPLPPDIYSRGKQ